jgi:signal transduction histidine kinase
MQSVQDAGPQRLETQVRELRFLFRLTALIHDRELPLEVLLEHLVGQLPQAYQYPSIACARVECEDRVVQSPGFRLTEWEQSASIGTLLARGGRITVCYLEPRPERAEGPFLEEERELLNTAGELLGERLERERTRELLEEVFAGTHFLIAYLDRDLRYQRVNPAYARAAGLKPEDCVGRSHFSLFPDRELETRVRQVLAGMEPWATQDIALPGFSPKTNFDLEILPLGRRDAAATGVVLILINRSRRRRALAQMRQSRQELARLTSHLQDLREEERRRIAREIHDELGGILTSIKMELALLSCGGHGGGAPAGGATAGAPEPALERANRLVDHSITLIRRIASDLRPQLLDDLGLFAALEWLASEFSQRTGVRCRFTPPAPEVAVPREEATALFRIVQEALTNVARHAGASCVAIRVEAGGGLLKATVRDDGRGITPVQAEGPESFGLIGMRERAAHFGGRVRIQGRPKAGTTLSVEIPLEAAG